MPKRSNDFQRLIAFIEKELAVPNGFRVTESSEMVEYEGSSMREIDVLIEGEINGHPIRIAIECRDRGKRQDKEWIDALIGKYRDLGIPNIIAVSRYGFTRGAVQKAERVGIRTLTLEEALETDWKKDFPAPRMRILTATRRIERADVSLASPSRPTGDWSGVSDAMIFDEKGEPRGLVKDVAARLCDLYAETAVEAWAEAVGADVLLQALSGEGAQRTECMSLLFEVAGHSIMLPNGNACWLTSIDLRINVMMQLAHVNLSHYFYNDTLVSMGKLDMKDALLSVAMVRLPTGDEPFKIAYTNVTLPNGQPRNLPEDERALPLIVRQRPGCWG